MTPSIKNIWLQVTGRAPRALAVTAPAVATTEQGYVVEEGYWVAPDDEQSPELRWPNNIEIYDRMRRQDAQVISVLRAVTLPILRTPWRIDPNGAPDEVVAFVAANLGLPVVGREPEPMPRTRGRFSWQTHLRHALLCLPFGHSVFEQTYRIAPDETGQLRAWLRKLGWRPPRTLTRIDVAPDGGLIAIHQGPTLSGGHKMDVDRLVVYTNDREGGNWLGQSLLRPAYKFWLLKDRLLRVQAQTIDRNGMGVPLYTASEVPSSVTNPDEIQKRQTEEVGEGLKIARGLRSGDSAGASIPHGADVKLLGVEGTLPDATPPIKYYDEQIARAVLAHFLNLGSETGSWALGSTFADFFTLSLQSVGLEIADTATKHIVEDLVDLNFGPDVQSPRIVFDEIGSHQQITADSIQKLLTAGALTADDELEQWVRQLFGMPAFDDSTEKRERPAATPTTSTTSEGDDGDDGDDVSDAERARFAAETIQKVYLGVGPVIDKEEARELARRAGADLKGTT